MASHLSLSDGEIGKIPPCRIRIFDHLFVVTPQPVLPSCRLPAGTLRRAEAKFMNKRFREKGNYVAIIHHTS